MGKVRFLPCSWPSLAALDSQGRFLVFVYRTPSSDLQAHGAGGVPFMLNERPMLGVLFLFVVGVGLSKMDTSTPCPP